VKRKKAFIFTNKIQSKKGIMATILGIISFVSILSCIYITYKSGQEATSNCGVTVFLSLIFSLTGMTLAVVSRTEKDKYYIYSYIGMVLNFLVISCVSIILFAGAKGL